ncbi:pilus assembly protein [Microbulbifer variabilis]|uniref:pilus assembly protein n=1 Tax=Microbulbifer variabilis TaxID=266805 RepID=UPI001CFE6334|nr:PilC/PilY family type IV pilus protein [Microbulbifer variabilis]
MLNIKKYLKYSSVVVSALITLGVTHSAVSMDLAQQPLFLQTSADPNIMFILDDSGSMQFEVTPSDYTNIFSSNRSVYYVYPAATDDDSANVEFESCIYSETNTSKCDYWNNSNQWQVVPKFEADNPWAAFFRSSHNNKTYYDPEIRYTPWAKKDGTLWDDASPTKAYHNPFNKAKGWRNLKRNNKQKANCWIKKEAIAGSRDNLCESGEVTFRPSTYFKYIGPPDGTISNGALLNVANYTRVQIKGNNSTYPKGEKRTDCSAENFCTYQEEIQNFANWYSYYRSRVLMSRAGIGQAFAAQGEGLRVGFGSLNSSSSTVDGESTATIKKGVRAFKGDDRSTFFDTLYGIDIPAAGTPLLTALDNAGKYYQRKDNKGPWSGDPGATNDTTPQLACRAAYTILMTDGYGNDYSSVSVANYDSDNGVPFADTHDGTLADIAMKYYENDLHPGLADHLPVKENALDTATYQHMVTFGVALGVTGDINPADAFKAITDKTSILWNDPDYEYASNATKLDDLLHAAVNSRGGFYSAGDPTTFASQLSAVLSDISGRSGSASAVAANSTRLGTDTAIFQALFDSNDWSGEVRSIKMNEDGTLKSISTWNTSESGKIPTSSRKIKTYNANSATGSKTVDFTWASLNDTQKEALKGGDDETVAKQRLSWVAGQTVQGLRSRSKLLGDIVNSTPVLADNRDQYFSLLPASLGGSSYADYLSNTKKSSRTEVLYVGANDGMLHGINASTGAEVFAYVPKGIYSKLKNLAASDYGSETNPHQYFVDGPLFVGDAYFKKNNAGSAKWMNILVGTYGAGAKGLFVLDVSDPSSPEVLFELDATAAGSYIGNILGRPLVVPTAAGWKLIFGNGYKSSKDMASLVVVDLANPNNFKVIPTSDNKDNGLAEPSLLIDAKGLVNTAYAGDLLGNLWKFDLSDSDMSKWDVSLRDGDSDDAPRLPLFTATDVNGNPQSITAAPTLGANPRSSDSIMVYFGTGQYMASTDNAAGTVINSFYALEDTGERLEFMSVNNTGGNSLDKRTSLLMEKKIVESGNSRTISKDKDEWWGDDLGNKKGWFLDFGAVNYGDSGDKGTTGERIISKPLLVRDRLIFPTLVTSSDPCDYGATGWTMELVGVGDTRFINDGILDNPNSKQASASTGFSGYIIAGRKVYVPFSETSGEYGNHTGEITTPSERLSWRKF